MNGDSLRWHKDGEMGVEIILPPASENVDCPRSRSKILGCVPVPYATSPPVWKIPPSALVSGTGIWIT